jgi:hypothetical protein
MFRVRWRSVATLAAALCLTSVARAGDDADKAADKPGPTGLTLNDFIAPAAFSMPKLSPSGKQLVLVRRVGEEDQILLMPVAESAKPRVMFTAGRVTPELAKKKWRKYISYLGWKTEDTLLVSVSMPVRLDLGTESETFDEPVHMILPIDGKSAPVFLNGTVQGHSACVDLSEIQNVLKADPDHVLLTVWPGLQSIEVDRVDIHTRKREVLDRGGTTSSPTGRIGRAMWSPASSIAGEAGEPCKVGRPARPSGRRSSISGEKS